MGSSSASRMCIGSLEAASVDAVPKSFASVCDAFPSLTTGGAGSSFPSEPSLGLSPLLVEQMFDLIKQINEGGLSIVLVEQNVMQSLKLADRAYVIENGMVTLSGPAGELIENTELKKSYLGI